MRNDDVNQASRERGTRLRLFIAVSTVAVSLLCFTTPGFAACDKRAVRTIGEYALVAGGAGTAPSGGTQQGTTLFGVGLGVFINSRFEVEGDLMLTPTGSIAGGGQIEVLPFRDAFTTGCLIPYLSAGGAGDSDYLYAGPSIGGGFKYYHGGPVGLGVDARAVFPQVITNNPSVYKGTVYMVTLRLLFEPSKD